jgi:epoxyqueuosine reductase
MDQKYVSTVSPDQKTLLPGLIDDLETHGYKASTIAARHADELQSEIYRRFADGQLDPELYQRYLAKFLTSLPSSGTIFVVSYALPITRLTFHWKGRTGKMLLPPIFSGQPAKTAQAEELLSQWLSPAGYSLQQVVLPKKLLAARSGLASYGRNNISYVEGFGSFHALDAFYSDLPIIEDRWQPARIMPICESCTDCLKACPTGAIQASRFLVQAEKCLTFFNENPGAFPDWLEASWHNSLVGCLRCQMTCPQNRSVKGWVEDGGDFSEKEVELILQNRPPDALPAVLVTKLADLDLLEYQMVLGRNLSALLNRASPQL